MTPALAFVSITPDLLFAEIYISKAMGRYKKLSQLKKVAPNCDQRYATARLVMSVMACGFVLEPGICQRMGVGSDWFQ